MKSVFLWAKVPLREGGVTVSRQISNLESQNACIRTHLAQATLQTLRRARDDETDYPGTSAKTKIHCTHSIPAAPKRSHPNGGSASLAWAAYPTIPLGKCTALPGSVTFGGGNPTLPLREGPHHQTQVISLDTLPLPVGIDKCGPFKTEHV
jgi:hypothetical protein